MESKNQRRDRTIVGISGNITRPSKTRALVDAIVREAEAEGLGRGLIFDVIDAGPELGATVDRSSAAPAVNRILAAIEQCDALVVATPVYKASYTGLLKHLFDLIDPKLLVERPVILAATGGSDRHALVIEHSLRPLFAFFRAHAIPTGIYATNGDFTPDGGLTEAAAARIVPAVAQLGTLLSAAPAASVAPAIARVA
jgi:FMN reductase